MYAPALFSFIVTVSYCSVSLKLTPQAKAVASPKLPPLIMKRHDLARRVPKCA